MHSCKGHNEGCQHGERVGERPGYRDLCGETDEHFAAVGAAARERGLRLSSLKGVQAVGCSPQLLEAAREVRRGKRYDGIFLDPPKFGRGPDGVWHMLWTWGWTRGQGDKSVKLGYAESKDLEHWSEQREIPVLTTEPAARNASASVNSDGSK